MENYLQVESLTKSFGDLLLFRDLSFCVNQGERIGLIARNGYGKSTLLNIIMGREDSDSGEVTFGKGVRVAYLVQEPRFSRGITVLEACFQGDSPSLRAISQYERALESGDHDLLQKAMVEMDALGAWDYESKAKQILSQLKIEEFDKPVELLSGGQLKRVALANALIIEPELLILDEPTNHLDLQVTTWLEEYLAGSRISLLMVTHDRYYLDRVCNRILEIEDRTVYSYSGNYNYYLAKREQRLEAEASQRQSDQNLFKKELDWMRRQPQARATKAKSRIESFYELEDRLRRERSQGAINLSVGTSYIGKKIFEMAHINKRFGDRVILSDFTYTFSRFEKMGIVGDNGVGKSTFIRMLLGEVAPDSGTVDIGSTVRFGYYSQQGGIDYNEQTKVIDVVADIAEHIELSDGRRMTASQLLQHFLFSPKRQYDLVHKLSGGERRRLYLCTVLMRSPNFLVLDEPTNDLDIMTLQVLEEYLRGFGGCVIVVSHDRYFMDKVADHLLVFEGEGVVRDFPSSYSDFLVWQELRDRELASAAAAQQAPKEKRKADKPVPSDRPAKLSFKEKRELEQIEVDMVTLEERKAELETQLNSGTLSVEDLTAKSIEVSQLIERIDTISMRWLELSERE
ncbi:MAG: ABC-F family ATP-binding cassette domain-containing protein [Rikenellaceae bacterium]